MQAAHPSPRLARRRRLIAFCAISFVFGLLAVVLSLCKVSVMPPGIEMRQLQENAAVTHAVLEVPPSTRLVTPNDYEGEAKRATLIANVISSPSTLDRIGRIAGVDGDRIEASTEITEGVSRSFSEPDSERRADQILTARDPYRLDIQGRPTVPIIDIYAQAPSLALAETLANATVKAGNAYLAGLAEREGHADEPLTLTQLGPARGGPLDPSAPIKIAALAFVVVFAISFGLLFLLSQVRRGWLRAGSERAAGVAFAAPVSEPAAEEERLLDDWPHTTRILPWMVAGFIAMLWLLPINAITVQASLPIDLKLDRLVLPVIVLTWLLTMAAGGRAAPRWRFTPVHAAVSAFVAVAFLSVVLNAAALDHTLELQLAIKKLTLLGAFFSVFLLVASIVRRTEVRAFMTLMLGLAVVAALGVLWEYRFGVNPFYDWAGKLLPSPFEVTAVDTTLYDEIGRRAVIGPADLALEAVAMLSLALPIALVRVMHSNRTKERLLCGLATCLLLGAMIATYRKSALLAPVAVLLMLAYYRRRELLRLAPLGVIILISIPALAPNALGSIVDQFEPNRLGVSTVSDRVSDYDAIRPDLLSHIAFGRGFGSYEHLSYRVLDNDLLMRIVETGLVGLAAYLFMLLMAIGVATPMIRSRISGRAEPALAIAAATGAFLMLSVLYDVMSFPQAPYLLMVLFGFLAVLVGAREPAPASQAPAPVADAAGDPRDAAAESPGSFPVPV